MDDLGAARLDPVHVELGVAAGGFDDADALIDDDVDQAAVVLGNQGRQKGQVDPEGAVGEGAGSRDSIGKALRGLEGEGGQDPQPPGFGHRRHQLGLRDPHHSALDDRMLDSEILGHPCLENLRHRSSPVVSTLLSVEGTTTTGGFEERIRAWDVWAKTQNSIQVILLKHVQEHRLTLVGLNRVVILDLGAKAGDDPRVDHLQHVLGPCHASLTTQGGSHA